MVVLHGDNKDDLLGTKADIYCINPDGLPWLMKSGFLRKLRPDVLCVDESSQFKNLRSRRAQLLIPLLDTFSRRWTLTGTPSSNGYMDVFGQAYITDHGAALGPYITRYRNTYFDPTGVGGFDWRLRDGADKLIQKRLKPIVCRVDIGDFVKVPTQVDNPIYVDLPPDARKLYDRLEADLFAVLGKSGRTVTALSAAAAMTKCSQIASGGIYVDPADGDEGLLRLLGGVREVEELHSAKTDALELLHEELGYKPLLVAYDYHHDLARLRTRFGKDVPVLGTKGSGTRAMQYDQELERLWNRGDLPMLLGHPQSIGHGLNLQEAGNDVCWYSLTYDLELFIQFNKRVMRQGNKHVVCRIHTIIARATTDEAKLSALKCKDKSQRALLDALRDYGEYRGHTVANLNLLTRKG
jgi:hypothetical protein